MSSNILSHAYKTMGEELFTKYVSGMSSDDLKVIVEDEESRVFPWNDFVSLGVYMLIDINEDGDFNVGYVGNPTSYTIEAAMDDPMVIVFLLGVRKLKLENVSLGTIFTLSEWGDEEQTYCVGVKVGSDHWEVSGVEEMWDSAKVRRVLNFSEGGVEFYLNGQKLDVETEDF